MNAPIQQNRSPNGLKARMMLYLNPNMRERIVKEAKRQRKSQQLIVHEALEKVFR